ncbi:MAG: 23S rRNA (guanosine(2251)-2'-O)-methyltransferase RlmB [Clostridia bacterium]|nr:23S rRNA (guanosine(2251)-2'-O)-methyltransferase RlmB [Clostridia bacterium]
MRESYRDKQSRKARINNEKREKDFQKKNNKRKYSSNEKRVEKTERPVREESKEEKVYDDVVAGRNAVMELLKSDKDINKIFVERGEKHGSINEIVAKAKENKVVLVEVDKSKLDVMAENHQGVVAVVPPFNYCEIEDILQVAESKGEDPFILILDGIEDPHNLGAIIRTAETAGCHGVIIPKRRNAAVNSTVTKVSAGATTYVKIARVNNLNDTIRKLKDAGLWVIGTDGSAKTMYYNQDLKGPLAIIIGSEGFGMSKLVKENADILIKIPMKGQITSLNASVSAGIVIYEAVKQRIQ